MTLTEINTSALGNFIRIHGNANDQKLPEVIDVNIKTNLTVSNPRSSEIVKKLLFIFVLFFAGIFAILLFNVRRELQALKSQEQDIENKVAILVTKYEKVSSQLSRVRSHMNYQKYYQPLTTSDEYERDTVISASYSTDETAGRYNKLNTAGLTSLPNDKVETLIGSQENLDLISEGHSKENSNSIETDDFGDTAVSDKDARFNFTEDNRMKNGNRFTRTILNSLNENHQASVQSVHQNFTDAESNLNKNSPSDLITSNMETDDNINLQSEPRTARMRRDDERRGKIRTKKKRRPNRSRRRLGPLVATFVGGIPEQHITDAGAIGPWAKMTKNTSHYDLQKFHLVDNKKAIEITMNGLYMISAQIFYFGQHTNYSYWILLSSEGQSTTQRVTKCSVVSSTDTNEVSCNTNVVLYLHRGDRLHVQQQEYDRLINLREGHSYIQLVLLSNESQRKPRVI